MSTGDAPLFAGQPLVLSTMPVRPVPNSSPVPVSLVGYSLRGHRPQFDRPLCWAKRCFYVES